MLEFSIGLVLALFGAFILAPLAIGALFFIETLADIFKRN